MSKKCLTALVGKAFPEEYTIQTRLHMYLNGQSLISVCVCVSHLPKVLIYFLALRAIFRQIMYICQENPQILGILQRLIAIREQIIIFICKRAFEQARKYLGQGDNWPRYVCPCLALACTLRSYLRYSAVACDQAKVLK